VIIFRQGSFHWYENEVQKKQFGKIIRTIPYSEIEMWNQDRFKSHYSTIYLTLKNKEKLSVGANVRNLKMNTDLLSWLRTRLTEK
jgi:hypothetical protein